MLMISSCVLAEPACILSRIRATRVQVKRTKTNNNNDNPVFQLLCLQEDASKSNRTEQWRLHIHGAVTIYSRSSEAEGDEESEGTQERFWSDSILMQPHTKEVLVLPPPPKSISTTFSLVFDRNITSKTTSPPFQGPIHDVVFLPLCNFFSSSTLPFLLP